MSNINDDFDILSIEESIQPPSAPEIDDFSKEINQDVNFDLKGIQRLQEYERNLVKLDRLFISRGARFILIIPILVILLYGFAESFTGSEPDWWVNHVLPVIPFNITIEVGFYYLAFFFIIADLGLLCLLLLLKSSDPKTTAEAIVLATHRYQDPDSVAEASRMIGEAMPGLEIETLDVRMEKRGW